MNVRFRSIPETEASIGWAGGHTVVVDRPDGTAGGRGLGFNGGQLLALAIGGCLCNDLRYVGHEMKIRLSSVEVDVSVAFDGVPLLATGAEVKVGVGADADGEQVRRLIARACDISAVSNSLRRGIPVEFPPTAS